MRHLIKLLGLSLLLCALAAAQHRHAPAPGDAAQSQFSPCRERLVPATLIPDLGSLHHPVSTKNAEAQRFFNQGLTLVYGFNHEEAARSFRRAAELDPTLAMAYWGIALAVGPNINIDIDPTCETFAYENIQTALRLAASPATSAQDRAYVRALSARYTNAPNPDLKQLAVDYKVAMGELVRQFPGDPDAATLFAESAMDLRPWKLWDDCGKPAQDTEQILAAIAEVLRRNPTHIGATHYNVHAREASPDYVAARASADLLRTLVPNAGHLVHMSSHIYARMGRYDLAAASNEQAVRVDQPYVSGCAQSIDAPTCLPVYVGHYYSHNLLFLAVSYGEAGRSQDAQRAAEMAATNALRYIRQQPSIEHFLPAPVMMLARFGRWDDILNVPPPADPALHITNAMWHWGRAMAYAAKGQIDKARGEQQLFDADVQATPLGTSWGNNDASSMYPVASNMLRGKLATARGQHKAAVEFMRLAKTAYDALTYDEPNPWFIPVAEALGAALLRDGDYAEAERVFRADLARRPANPRSLLGLSESLKARGLLREASAARSEFERAGKAADVPLRVEDF